MFDAVNALDNGLKLLGDELNGVRGFEPVGAHRDVDHRNADLRLLLARDDKQRDQANRERGE